MTDWDPGTDPLGLIRALSAVAAPAGHEDRLTAAVGDHLAARGLDPVIDRLGQVAVTIAGTAHGPSTLVSAHLDELGLVVRGISDDGWLRVHRLGGMPERVLPGARLAVHTRAGDLPAVVGVKSHHLTPAEEKYVALPATELYLDVGAGDRAQVTTLGVRVGDPVSYAAEFDELAGGRFAGKSLDDRVGVAALLRYVDRLLEHPPKQTVHIGFTTQEEFHVRGALALVARFGPDVVINVDVAPATDTPDLVGAGSVRLGGGPTLSRLSFHGRGTLGGLIPHPGLVRAVEQAAASIGMDIQHDAMIGIITDAAFVPMASAEGIAAVGIGIPVRYTHSPVETAQLSDVLDTTELLVALTDRMRTGDLSRGSTQLRHGGLG
ncbi:MAG: M20/M25/M40 family metallo-hydrolase [Pseudonocardia sp.]|nr:M20/M25/M40 family metallo-hydrolase [Pseudonocardia sp.]